MKLYLLTLMAACLGAHAQVVSPTHIDVYGVSYHFASNGEHEDGFNERNTGIGATWADVETDKGGKVDAHIGIYRNSYSKTTVHAGVTKNLIEVGGLTAGVTAGLATGYGAPVLPYAALRACYGYACITSIPASKNTIGVAGLTFRIAI